MPLFLGLSSLGSYFAGRFFSDDPVEQKELEAEKNKKLGVYYAVAGVALVSVGAYTYLKLKKK